MTRKELRRGSDQKERIVHSISSCRVTSPPLPPGAATRRFLKQYVADIPVDDLMSREPRIIAQIALTHLELGTKRRKGQLKIRIFNPTEEQHGYTSPFTFIEMVNDDMPFLVNSVTAAINRHDLIVHVTVHPIIRVVRGTSSWLPTWSDGGTT